MPTTLATWRRYVASGGTLRAGYPSNLPPPPPALAWLAPDTLVQDVPGIATITNTGAAASGPWSLSQLAGLMVSPASGSSIAAGSTQTVTLTPIAPGSYDLVLSCAGATISGNPQTVVVSPVPVLAASYDAPAALTVNVAGSGSIQNTGNQPLVWSIAAPAHLTVTPSAGTLAAGATQALAFLADQAGSFTTSLSAPGASITGNPRSTTATLAQTFLLTFSVPSTATVNAAVSGSIQNTGTGSVAWSITPPAHVTVVPSSGTPAGGATQALSITIDQAGPYSLVLSAPTATITGNPQSITATASVTTATLTGPNTAAVGVAYTARVTLNATADRAYTVTPIRSDGGTGPATYTIAQGSLYVDIDTTWSVVGTLRTVDFTISPSLQRAGNPITLDVISDLGWTFSANGQITLRANQDTIIATGVPTGSSAVVSPALPPGASLLVPGDGTIIVRCDATLPYFDPTSPDPVLAAIAVQDQFFDAFNGGPMLATIQNATQSITYPPQVGLWNTVMNAANPGDTILVSPGAIHQIAADLLNYESNNLDSCMLAINRPIAALKNMPGRGDWWLWNGDDYRLGDIHGICVFAPGDSGGVPGQITLLEIEGFSFDNWGRTASSSGVKIRTKGYTVGSWADKHIAVALRNFKIGKPAYEHSASGISGAARTLTIENGHVYDTGDGVGGVAGNDHNAYVTAETLNFYGVWFQRTRGMSADGLNTMDGHLLKASAVTANIEGCVFDSDPLKGDNSFALQAKAGGDFRVRSCLFRDSVRNMSQGRGQINMCREVAADGVTPNYEWWAANGKLLVERCAFLGHYGRSPVWFFPVGSANYMGPGSAANQISTVTIRDNVGMVAGTPTTQAPFTQAKWIMNDPTGGADWATRGNDVVPYSADEVLFASREIKKYSRLNGVTAASSLAVKRFVHPRGWVADTSLVRGLQ